MKAQWAEERKDKQAKQGWHIYIYNTFNDILYELTYIYIHSTTIDLMYEVTFIYSPITDLFTCHGSSHDGNDDE